MPSTSHARFPEATLRHAVGGLRDRRHLAGV